MEASVSSQLFNGAVETGLRSLVLLTSSYPDALSLDRLVIYDYLLVHSDDVVGGPTSLHPKTPYRGGEILIRRGTIQDGLLLYLSRGLVAQLFVPSGWAYSATEKSAAFLDTLAAPYAKRMRDRSQWVTESFAGMSDTELSRMVTDLIGAWGAEFTLDSVLWSEDDA